MSGNNKDLEGLVVSFAGAVLPPTHHVWDQKTYPNPEGSVLTAFLDVATGEHAFKRNNPAQPLFQDHEVSQPILAEELDHVIG